MMNPADIAVLGTILLCGLLALAMGFVRTVLALASWAGAGLVTLWGFTFVRQPARDLVGSNLFGDVAAGVGVFIVALIAFSIVSHLLSALVRKSPLNVLDRTLGFALGLGIGVVVVALAWLGVSALMPKDGQPEWLKTARTIPVVERAAEAIKSLLPPELRKGTEDAVDDATKRAKQSEVYRGALDALTAPAGTKPAPQEGETGYKSDDRQRLDNLFQTRQGGAPSGPGAPPR